MSFLTPPRVPLARVLAALALFGAPAVTAAAAPAPPAEATASVEPIDITISNATVSQSSVGSTLVGTLSASDDGSTPLPYNYYYSLVSGPGSTSNGFFTITGDQLYANDPSLLSSGPHQIRIRVVEDNSGGSYEESLMIYVHDDVTPVFQNGTPSVSGTTSTSTTLAVELDEVGTAYYVVLADGASAPSVTQVKAGQDASGTPVGNGSIAVSAPNSTYTDAITGLSAGTAYDVYVVAEDDEGTPNLQASPTLVDVTTVAFDADGSLVAGSLTGPIGLPTTAVTAVEAIDIFDFDLVDGGTSDGTAMDVTGIDVQVSGPLSDADLAKLVFRLNGPDAAGVAGTYSTGTVSFSGLSISVADGASETYTVSAYWSDNTGLVEGDGFNLNMDSDVSVAVGASGTQMGATSIVTGPSAVVAVEATVLAVTTQPAGSVSGTALTTQPVVTAQDAFGNTDLDFTETVTLAEANAGALSGDVDVAADHGVATFADVAYTAMADQEAFTLTANDEDGTGTDLPTVDANAVTSDVVATALAFATQPAPTSVASGDATAFTTVPAVHAVDAAGTLDTDYSGAITIAEANGAGSAALTGTGDTDGDAATVSLTSSAGVATFTGLAITYTAGTTVDETFNLRALSGGLSTADSDPITATVNQLPSFATAPVVSAQFEDEVAIDLNALLAVTDADNDQTLTWTVVTPPSRGALGGFDATAAADGGTVTPSGLTYTPDPDANGPESFIIRVSDGLAMVDQTVSFMITAVNDAPSFTKGADVAVAKNAGLQTIVDWATAIAAGPVDEAGQMLAFDVTTDNADLFEVAPAIAPNGTLTFAAATNVPGTATVTVVLQDDGGTANGGVAAAAPQTFMIAVDAANFAPTISEFSALALEEDETSAPIAFTIEDAETATSDLTVTATSNNAALIAADGLVLAGDGAARTLTVTPVANAFGSAQVTVTVTDGDLETSTGFTVLVQAANDAPGYAADAPAPTVGGAPAGSEAPLVELPAEADSSQTVVLDFAAAVDAEGDSVSYQWQFIQERLGELIGVASAHIRILSLDAGRTSGAAEMLRGEVPVSFLDAVYDSLDIADGTEVTVSHRIVATDGEATSYSPSAELRLVRAFATAAEDATLPTALTVEGNYPNPVAQATRIRYALPTATPVRLEVFDTLGRRVAVLVDEAQAAGWHEATLDASRFESGTYLYRVVANGEAATRSLVVVK